MLYVQLRDDPGPSADIMHHLLEKSRVTQARKRETQGFKTHPNSMT